MATSNLIQTGIDGLDTIFLGGILKGNIILVEGAPGTGKTLTGLTFIYRGVVEYDEPGLIVVFEVSPDKLIRDMAAFGWDVERLQEQGKLEIIFTSPQVLEQELRSPDSLLLEAAAKIGAQRIFIDGISLLRPIPNGNGTENGSGRAGYRDLLQQVIEGLQRENLTAMVSHELTAQDENLPTLEVAEFVSDTVIRLSRERIPTGGIHRSIEIIKSRGQGYDQGKHTLQIDEWGGPQS